jgi:AraC-like DNA-binding protein
MMRSQLVAPFLAQVQAAGEDPNAIIRRFGLPEDAASVAEVELPLSTLYAFLEAVEQATADPYVGVHVASALPRGTYGLLEFCSRSAPTVREALRRIARYISLMNELVVITLSESSCEGVIEQKIPGVSSCVGRHANEFFVATILLHARRLSGSHCVARRAWFAHPAPSDLSPLWAVTGTRAISFDAGFNGVAVGPEVLDLPLVSSDPPLLSLLERQAEQALAERAGASRFLGQVQLLIRQQLPGGRLSLEDMAASLKMSRRTLQRRFAGEGVSFIRLVDGVRRELACRYLKEGGRPLGEVAFLLGYTEMSAFFHAFRRWTGTTPSKFRGSWRT